MRLLISHESRRHAPTRVGRCRVSLAESPFCLCARRLPVCFIFGAIVGCGSDGGSADAAASTSTSTNGNSTSDSSSEASGTSSSTGGSGGPVSGQACDPAARVDTLSLRLSGGKTLLSGAILDSVNPAGVFDVVASEGACDLLVPRDLFCSQCAASETCAGQETCVPKPTKQSAGSVTITGLRVPLEAEPNGITGEYNATLTEPYPAFEPGAALSLSASGDFFGAFTLAGWGIAPMVTSETLISVAPGSPVALTWDTANVDPEQTEVFVNFSVNVHGATTGWIECTVADIGAFSIPAGLVSQLVDRGLSGFPRMDLVRRSIDSTTLSTGGCLQFEVSSTARIELEVEGLTSCNEMTPCPTGHTCSPEFVCE